MRECDILIIGAGPAGLAAGIYAGRAASSAIVLEKAFPGGQVATASDIENYPGFPDGVHGIDLADKMRQQAERFDVDFVTDHALLVEHAQDGGFKVTGELDTYAARAVIVAAGSESRRLGIPGEDRLRGRGVSYCGTCDAPFFKNKRVAVVGGGNSALKESLHLARFASHVNMYVRKAAFGRADHVYKVQVTENEKIDAFFNVRVVEILGGEKVEAVKIESTLQGDIEVVPVDGVFVFVGTEPNTGLVSRILGQSPTQLIRTDHRMMTSVPGLFAVGDVRLHSFRQVATAVGEGAAAALAAEEYIEKLGDGE